MSFANLKGMNAVVTGSSTGIGRAVAIELAQAGCGLVIHGRTHSDELDKTKTAIAEFSNVHVQVADLSTVEACTKFVDAACSQIGEVDIWVNNAGVDLLTGAAADFDYETKLQLLLDIDVRSTVLISRRIGARMQQRGKGCIINVGWDQADRGMDGNSGELFAAAKNSVMGFSRSLAVSLAPEVRVNCVAPGWILTEWGAQASDYWQQRVMSETPLQRWGTPGDIAGMVRFLCSAEASFITGQVINVNGGAVR